MVVPVFGCLIWLPLMFWVLSLVQWMIMGEIDAATGVFAVLAGIGLGILAIAPPSPILAPISFLIVVVTMLLYPFLRHAMNRKELRSVDVDAMARVYESLGQRPTNPSARIRLAQYAWTLGMPGHALTIAEESLKQMPVQHFREEHRMVGQWKKHPLGPERYQPISCEKCNFYNPPGEVYCGRCGAPFLLLHVRRGVGPGPMGRRMVAAWIAMVAVLAGIPASTSLAPLWTMGAIVSLLAAAAVVLWLAFRPALEDAV
ncbi:MAG TPA: zinc ribbon domain-containing protein [Fimbriimonas sp.]